MAFTLRTDDELEAALDELSQSTGESRQEISRRAILYYRSVLGHRERVDQTAQAMLAQWHDVLQRLATT